MFAGGLLILVGCGSEVAGVFGSFRVDCSVVVVWLFGYCIRVGCDISGCFVSWCLFGFG